MKYYRIRTDWDSKTTGRRNGGCAVEQNKNSFTDKRVEKNFKEFFIANIKNIERTRWGSYAIYEPPQDFELTYFPKTKSIKELDIMNYSEELFDISFLISERAYEILAKYRLPIHNKIPAKIATFSQDYFLVGFPTLLANTFDFDKSIFYNEEGKVTFRDVNDYENAAYNRHMAIPSLLYLNIQMEYDVIKTRKGLFFAQSLVEELEKKEVTGYVIENGILEN